MCINMLQSTYDIDFSMTDLIVKLCSQNKGQYYLRVVSFPIQEIKLCKVEGYEKDTNPLSTISHILVLVLSEDSSTREIGVENGLVGVKFLLTNFIPNNPIGEKVVVLKWVIALLVILDHMLQCKLQLTPYVQKTIAMGGNSLESESKDTTLVGAGAMDNVKILVWITTSKEIVHS